MKKKTLGSICLGLMLSAVLQTELFAQTAEVAAPAGNSSNLLAFVMIMLASVMLAVVGIVFYFAAQIIEQTKQHMTPEAQEKFKDVHLMPSFSWKVIDKVLTDAVPLEHEQDVLLDHNYDGIRELDNHLPPWWKWLFYGTIVYAVVHLFFMFVMPDATNIWIPQEKEYEIAMADAALVKAERQKLMANLVDETSVELLTDANSLLNGKKVFTQYCAVCHGNEGQGGTGPTFADNYWIHGNTIQAIFKTVKYGVQGKGMAAWEGILSPPEIAEVASYLTTFVGTTPPNMKAPQGVLYSDDPSTESVEGTGTDSTNTAPVEPAIIDSSASVTL